MTRLISVLALVAVIAVVGIVAGGGCGARIKVFGKTIVDKVDKALGELKVKMQEIEDEKAKIEVDLKRVRKSLYTSEAKLELLTSKKDKAEAKIAGIKESVKKLSGFISEAQASEDGSVEVKGKTYTKMDLQKEAEKITSQFENAQIELEGFQQRMDIYSKSISFLTKQESAATDMLAKLDTKIKTIRTKRDTIESVQSDAILNADNTSLTERLAKLAEEVDEMDILSDVEFKIAQDDLEKIDMETTEADSIFAETPSLDATQNSLLDILGE